MALDAELKVFDNSRDEWLKHHANKFVLIRGSEVAGFFDSAETAFVEGIERWGNVSFLIKKVAQNEPPERLPALMYGLIDGNS